MKVLLLNPPGDKLYMRDNYCSFSSKADYYWPPIDLLNLSGTISSGHQVEMVDAIVTKMTAEETTSYIIDSGADVVIFVTGLASWHLDIELIRKLKEKKSNLISIASGGFLLTKGAAILKEYPCLDAILLDFTTSDVLTFLEQRYDDVHNMIFRLNGQILKTKDKIVKPYSIAVPRHDIFPISRYRISTFTGGRFSSVITSMGCAYNCAFCIYSATRFSYRDVNNTLEEIKFIRSLGIKNVTFVDPDFTFSKSRTMEICSALLENKIDIKWSCNSRVTDLDKDLLEVMKKSGCTTIQFGLESASNDTLDKYRKRTDSQSAKQIIALCAKLGISSLGYFIIGLPGEDEAAIVNTIRFAKSLPLDYASFSTATPRIGTDMWKECLEKGWIKDDDRPFDMSGEPFIETQLLSRPQIKRLKKRAYKEFYLRPHYIIRKMANPATIGRFPSLVKDAFKLLRKNL